MLIVFILSISVVCGWLIKSPACSVRGSGGLLPSLHGSSHTRLSQPASYMKRTAMVSGVMIVTTYLGIPRGAVHQFVQPVCAEEVVTKFAASAQQDSNADEQARIERKLKRQREVARQSMRNDKGGFVESLEKEKLKLKAQKRSKAQKAKDLCEMLGRGC